MSGMQLTQALRRAAQQKPEGVATIYKGRRATYGELLDRAARCGGLLRALGLEPGDRVAVLARNRDAHLEVLYGAWTIGCVVTLMNARWTSEEVSACLRDSDARLLFVDELHAPSTERLRDSAPGLQGVLYLGEGAAPPGAAAYEDAMASSAPVADGRFGGEAAAVILYTGGTTGLPKGAVLTHANLHVNALTGLAERLTDEQARFLLVLPLFHISALFFLLAQVTAAAPTLIAPAFDPVETARLIEREHVTHLGLVPTMLQMLIDHPEAPAFRLGCLRQIVYGASPISEPLLTRAMARLPEVAFVQAYGMTELGPLAAVLPAWRHTREGRVTGKLRSAGRAVFHAELKVVGPDGDELARGQAGELLVAGPGVMKEYWRDPAQTAESLRGGWMHTGDIASIDDDGFIFIIDRAKDVIISGGENVYSTEVENALASHPDVATCAVIGVPDDTWGERVHAVVALRPGAAATEAQLLDHCRQRLAGYKCPRTLEFRPELPMSAASKVLKSQLRAPYWRGRDRQVA